MDKNMKKITFFCSFVVIVLTIFFINKNNLKGLVYLLICTIYLLKYIRIRKEKVWL